MAKLTAKGRNSLPKNDFAGPDRSYPSGKPVDGKVKAAVKKKFPSIDQSGKRNPFATRAK